MQAGKAADRWSKPESPDRSRLQMALRLALYAGAALVLVLAALLLQLDSNGYAALLVLSLLGLVVRFVELRLRDRQTAAELAGLNAELRRALATSETLSQIGRELAGHVDLSSLLDLMARHAMSVLEADTAAVVTVNEETGRTEWMCGIGYATVSLGNGLWPVGQGLGGRTIASGCPLVVEDLRSGEAVPVEEVPYHLAEGIISVLAVPLARSGRSLGALVVGYRRRRAFTEREIGLLVAVAAPAAIALENARLYGAEKRKAAEMAAVVDHMGDGVIVTDGHGVVVRRNEAAVELLGEVAVGRPLLEVAGQGTLRAEAPHGTPLSPSEWPMMQASRGERFSGREVLLRDSEGRAHYLSVDGCPVMSDRGEVVLGVTVMHDETPAREMDQLKDEFLSLAAHELKTPLTSLKGYAQILLAAPGVDLGVRHRQALEAINRQVDRVNRMVEQFLRVAEIRSRRLALRPERVDLAAIVAGVCEDLGRITSDCEIVCGLRDRVEVLADPKSLGLVLANLVRNAVRYSPPGGRVEVEIELRGAEAVVAVRDQGVGIPKEKQGFIFGRFYQVQPGTNSEGGIGLGLYISQQLIESQGGRMWLESEEGHGSSFYFSVPVAAPEDNGG